MSLLTVGTVAFDAIQTPFGKTGKILGGAATFIGLSASKLVDKVNIVSVVGEDFPIEYIKIMEDHGIDTKGLQVKRGEKTFFWSGKYDMDMNNRETLDTQLNVLENFDPVIPDEYQNCKYLMLGSLLPTLQKKVIER